jgi:hypothetical protein
MSAVEHMLAMLMCSSAGSSVKGDIFWRADVFRCASGEGGFARLR